jgi:pantoate--beta-alanine ligase
MKLSRSGKTIGLVPTMGALHAGHLSLVSRARKENDIVVVSIFVNPTQFGPNEDYLRYPRPFAADAAACKKAGVDYLFAPTVESMYPDGYLTFVQVERMSETLCGKFRPGHFRGVTTVVSKLFNIVQPGRAYFGQKDFQQLQIIARMVKDLNFPVKIVPCPIKREPSGLALSRRNRYLSSAEREQSLKISNSLKLARELAGRKTGATARDIKKKMTTLIQQIPGVRIDYIELLHPETLVPVKTVQGPVLAAIAVWVGKTRLIDNMVIR